MWFSSAECLPELTGGADDGGELLDFPSCLGYQDSLLVERRARDQRVASSNPGGAAGKLMY